MRDTILDFLKKTSGYVSGEEVSHHLKVSRQALWKHIQELRDAGYDIVAVPHLGYRLVSVPDRLFASEVSFGLNTKLIGRRICYFDSLSSTMDAALKLGMEGTPEGTVVLAEAQTKGRGRLGRQWFSPKHKGIYLSLVLKPKIAPAQSPLLALLAGVSICEALASAAGIEAAIKWPNDILIGHRKVGGILTELSAEADAVRMVTIGIGINVNGDRASLPEGATSLKEEKGHPVSRLTLLRELLRRLEANYLLFQKDARRSIIEKWRQYDMTLGRRVKIASQGSHLEGIAADIDSDGGLLVRTDSGLTSKVTAGDVTHCR